MSTLFQQAKFLEAAQTGDLEKVKMGIAAGIDIETRGALGDTALIIAADKGNLAVAKYLLESGADIHAKNNDAYTPLIASVSPLSYLEIPDQNRLDIIKLMLEFGADKNMKTKHNLSALDCARDNELDSVVELLSGNYQESFFENKLLEEGIKTEDVDRTLNF